MKMYISHAISTARRKEWRRAALIVAAAVCKLQEILFYVNS
jgi:hypothetical protein